MNIADVKKQIVRSRYGAFAKAGGHREACCAATSEPTRGYAFSQGLYSEADLALVPDLALDLSRGCGNPTGFASLRPGEVVVDFGCGGGIDVILAAHRVGPEGRVVGVDFTPQMIERAREAVAKAGLEDRTTLRVEDMADTNVPDNWADVVISNCVINLVPDKDAVYREAHRLLRPGGRLAVSDVVLIEPIAPELQGRFSSTWAGCLGGAVPEADYLETARRAGFSELEVVARHVLAPPELEAMARCPGPEFAPAVATDDLADVQGKVESIKFTAKA
jgi:SAM-dependent methyltransferase